MKATQYQTGIHGRQRGAGAADHQPGVHHLRLHPSRDSASVAPAGKLATVWRLQVHALQRCSSVLLLLATLLLATAGCTSQPEHGVRMAPLSEMPPPVQQAPVRVREAYQFAVAHPEILDHVPCYCGCGAMGHASNYDCYVAGHSDEGQILFDEHALGCGICVDITQDAMRLLGEGKGVDEIFTYVDNTYSRFGPPTPLDQ